MKYTCRGEDGFRPVALGPCFLRGNEEGISSQIS
jgi:hypothetical protein